MIEIMFNQTIKRNLTLDVQLGWLGVVVVASALYIAILFFYMFSIHEEHRLRTTMFSVNTWLVRRFVKLCVVVYVYTY